MAYFIAILSLAISVICLLAGVFVVVEVIRIDAGVYENLGALIYVVPAFVLSLFAFGVTWLISFREKSDSEFRKIKLLSGAFTFGLFLISCWLLFRQPKG